MGTRIGSWAALLLAALLSLQGCGGGETQPEPTAGGPESSAAPADSNAEAVPAVPAAVPAAVPESVPAGGGEAVAPRQMQFTDVTLSPKAKIQAEKFDCICGCNLRLARCFCEKTPGSIDMKQHLQSLVDAGLSPEQIREGMIQKYGGGVVPK